MRPPLFFSILSYLFLCSNYTNTLARDGQIILDGEEGLKDTLPVENNLLKQVDFYASTNSVMYEDADGFIWIATENGLFRKVGSHFVLYSNIGSSIFRDIYEDSEKNLVIEFNAEDYVVIPRQKKSDHLYTGDAHAKITPPTSKGKNNAVVPTDLSLAPGAKITASFARNNKQFFGTSNGQLIFYDELKKDWHGIPMPDKDEIRDLLLDESGLLWILKPRSIWTYHLGRELLVKNNSAGRDAWHIEANGSNNIEITTSIQNSSQILSGNPNQLSPVTDTIEMLVKYSFKNGNNRYLLGKGDVLIVDNASIIIDTIPTNLGENVVLEHAIQLTTNRYIVLARNSGFYLLDVSDKSFSKLKSKVKQDSLLKSMYYAEENIFSANDNTDYLISTFEQGLFNAKIRSKGNDWVLESLHILSDSIYLKDVICFAQDKENGIIWIGTQKYGIIKATYYEYYLEIKERFDKKAGMINDKIYSIFVRNNNVWFYTDRGLGCLLGEKRLVFLDEQDGLPHLSGAGTSVAYDGMHLYFGTEGGTTFFNPDSLAPILEARFKNPLHTKINIEFFQNTKALSFGEKKIILIYNNESLQIRINNNDNFYADLENIQYAIAKKDNLKPEDLDWKVVERGALESINFEHYGTYFVYARVKTSGVWQYPAERIILIITPPWYLSLWFWGGLLLMFFLSIYFLKTRLEKGFEHEKTSYFANVESLEKQVAGLSEATEINFGLLKILSNYIQSKSPNALEIALIYKEYLKPYELSKYIVGLVLKFGDSSFKLYYYEREQWQEGPLENIEGTFTGYALKNGQPVIITDIKDEAQRLKYGVQEYAIRGEPAEALLIMPIKNGEEPPFSAIVSQSKTPIEYSDKQIGAMDFLSRYSLINENAILYPGIHFGESVQKAKEDWNGYYSGEAIFHFIGEWRPFYYKLVDNLFNWESDKTDFFFRLKHDTSAAYNQESLINKIFKGFAGGNITVGALILVFCAVVERKNKSNRDNPFNLAFFSKSELDDATLRNNSIVPNDQRHGELLQTAFSLGESLFFSPATNTSNIHSCEWDPIKREFKLILEVESAQKLKDSYESHRSGYFKNQERGGAGLALWNFEKLIKTECLKRYNFNLTANRVAITISTPDN
ncbi:MAG TPA: GAF domain-containing protein [Saprospiraceae bacterium]|nr:GAF domain-containing protein [Saprospiraceae bacterium]HMQ82057.1 GAF domain-containing protein [Saprospiraceae bacterium]